MTETWHETKDMGLFHKWMTIAQHENTSAEYCLEKYDAPSFMVNHLTLNNVLYKNVLRKLKIIVCHMK